MEPDKTGTRRRRRGESRLVRAELSLLLEDLVALEADTPQAAYDVDGAAGAVSLVIARVARRAIAAGRLTDVELGRLVLDAGRPVQKAG
jgi:hypothetical protein